MGEDHITADRHSPVPRVIYQYVSVLRRAICVLGLVLFPSVGCATSHGPITNPCALISRQELASAIGGHADLGHRLPAIGDSQRRVCTYGVTTSVRTVSVYLGQGPPPHGTGANASGATEAEGNVYVSLSAQFPDRNFPLAALRLARTAIGRATGH